MLETTDIVVFVIVTLWLLMIGSLVGLRGATADTPRWRMGVGVVELALEGTLFLFGLLVFSQAWLTGQVALGFAGGLLLVGLFVRVRWLLLTAVGLRPEWRRLTWRWWVREVFLGVAVLTAAVVLRRWLPWVGR